MSENTWVDCSIIGVGDMGHEAYRKIIRETVEKLEQAGMTFAVARLEIDDKRERFASTTHDPQVKVMQRAFAKLKEWAKREGLSLAELSRRMGFKSKYLSATALRARNGGRMIHTCPHGIALELKGLNNPPPPEDLIEAFCSAAKATVLTYHRKDR